jgi:fructan beta-fructosidase
MRTRLRLGLDSSGTVKDNSADLHTCRDTSSVRWWNAMSKREKRRPSPYAEDHRPRYHFTPVSGWMNDPNGLVHYADEYHLFYQYAPDTIEPEAPKHWGHAVSQDLLTWQHLPVAVSPDRSGAVWSGSAVVDWRNCCGIQSGDQKALAAFYTAFDHGHQEQALALSTDRGRTWSRHKDNPIVPNPGLRDFRDPKVFWHAESQRWVMALVAGDRVMIYTSSDLTTWAHASDFGALDGSHSGVWECPDLFPLVVDGTEGTTHWVLLVSVGPGSSPSGGSGGVQYFIGDFDGSTFVVHGAPEESRWLDYGRDNYAAVTFSDIPPRDGRRILIGWMSNWAYAGAVPTKPWRGAMTIPRELRLVAGPHGPELISLPIEELRNLRADHYWAAMQTVTDETALFPEDTFIGDAFEVDLILDIGTATGLGLKVNGRQGDVTVIGYDAPHGRVFVDRRRSGITDFHNAFAGSIDSAKRTLLADHIHLHAFFDRSSVELFADDGRVVITDLIFPRGAANHLTLCAQGGIARLIKADAWRLNGIWD